MIGLLAEGVMLLHFAFVLFVALGWILVLRRPRLAWLHVPAVVWGILVEAAGWICPLTPLEVAFRRRAGQGGYAGDFLDRYLGPILYPDGLTREVQIGLVHGFGFNVPCAVATTVAHDSHHMIVVGTDTADMARAANRLGEVGGGVVVFKEGAEIALVELPIAGLMSNERAEVVAAKAARMVAAMRECGCTLNNAYMQLSLLALVVIPDLRISDLGLVDVNKFEIVDLFVE